MSLVEKLYYDINICNLNGDQTISPPIKFIETRSLPFLQDPSKYVLSIIRFSVDTSSLPIIIPTIQANQPDINLTIYSVTLSYKPIGHPLIVIREYVRFRPQNLIATIPPPPTETADGLQDNSSGYYYIYNYQYWVYLINIAFQTAMEQLVAEIQALSLPVLTQNPPILIYDTTDRTAVLNVDIAGFDSSTDDYYKIYFNNNLYQLFSSFPGYITADSGDPFGMNFQVITTSFGGSTLIAFPTEAPPALQYTAIEVWQEYSTASIWSPVSSIVFTSSLLPIVPNQLSNPLLFNDGATISSNGNNASFAQIITDLEVQDGNWKPNLVYTPSAEFRYIELDGNRPLYTVDVQVWWKNKIGQLIPFRLIPGGKMTMKMLFNLKSSNK